MRVLASLLEVGVVSVLRLAVSSFKAQADAFIRENSPNDNYGSRVDLRLSNRGTAGVERRRAYLQFDTRSIPLGAVLESAELGLYYYAQTDFGIEIRPIYLESNPSADPLFDEMAITWNNAPALSGRYAYHLSPYPYGWIRVDITNLVRPTPEGPYLGGFIGLRIRQLAEIERTTVEDLDGPFFRSKEYMVALSAALTVTYMVEEEVPTALTITAPSTVELGESFIVQGFLYEIGTGRPVVGQTITLIYNGVTLGSAITNVEGVYFLQVTILEEGNWTLTASFGGSSASLRVTSARAP